jgi:hypothetical protein
MRYREALQLKERNKEEVFDSRAILLSNKNRRKKEKHIKRDERGAYMRLSCRHYMPYLGSLSSLFLFRLLTIIAPIITLNDRQEKVIESLIFRR